jgi:hypothetical protein
MTINGLDYARAKRRRAAVDLRGFDALAGQGIYTDAKQGAVFYVGLKFGELRPLLGKVYGEGVASRGTIRGLGYGIPFFPSRITGRITRSAVEAVMFRARVQQLAADVDPRKFPTERLRLEEGRKKAGATFTGAKGIYKGSEEPTIVAAVIFVGDDPDFDAFKKRMLRLGELLAYAFAQREVIIEIQNGASVSTHSASPIGFPDPTDSAATRAFLKAEGIVDL